MLRFGMLIFTQEDYKKLSEKEKLEGEEINYYTKLSFLKKKETLLREKIGIDKFKKELEKRKKEGNLERKEKIEYYAAISILKNIREFPYQITKNNYGYQPSKILENKEIYCIGYTLLGHSFLSELGIKHECLDMMNHLALSIIIGQKNYYFDATAWNDIVRFKYGRKKKGKLTPLNILGDDYFRGLLNELYDISYITKYAIKGNTEKILLSSIYNSKGVDLYNLGKHDESIIFFNKAIELNPYNYFFYNNKGGTLNNLGKYDEAKKIFDKAIELDPCNSSFYNNKGLALLNLGEYDEAKKIFDKAIELDSYNSSFYNNKGLALQKLGNKKLSDFYLFSRKIIKEGTSINDLFHCIFNFKKLNIIRLIYGNRNDKLRIYLLSLEKK